MIALDGVNKTLHSFFFSEMVRTYFGQQKQISVLFEDRPENDFKSIFTHFSGKSFHKLLASYKLSIGDLLCTKLFLKL